MRDNNGTKLEQYANAENWTLDDGNELLIWDAYEVVNADGDVLHSGPTIAQRALVGAGKRRD